MLLADDVKQSGLINEPPMSKWVLSSSQPTQARLKMFCFSHAGGGPSFYKDWHHFHPEVEILRVALPGREARRAEPAFDSMETLLPNLVRALAPFIDRPYLLFGHSMGAAIAYEVAKYFERQGRQPQHLFISGRRAPHLLPRRRPFYNLPDKEFLSVLSGLNGTPASVINDASLVELFLPPLRADFTLIETYQAERPEPVLCPISAYGGDSDPEVDCRELASWKQLTQGHFKSQIFNGDHFYLKHDTRELFEALKYDLSLA